MTKNKVWVAWNLAHRKRLENWHFDKICTIHAARALKSAPRTWLTFSRFIPLAFSSGRQDLQGNLGELSDPLILGPLLMGCFGLQQYDLFQYEHHLRTV